MQILAYFLRKRLIEGYEWIIISEYDRFLFQ